jgi:hypothetical protein
MIKSEYNRKRSRNMMLIHEKDIKTLYDTVPPMLCTDYKCRFTAEFYQLKIRYEKLKGTIDKYYEGTLNFDPVCPISLLERQLKAMGEYLSILRGRAKLEGIDL